MTNTENYTGNAIVGSFPQSRISRGLKPSSSFFIFYNAYSYTELGHIALPHE
ncbi:hypothetical protein [Acinetobacter tibetensis]|uniref:Uncharacterized protein n=1 Tax=Acinetobacter tibetensis TaxID=2943497 RepID=A0AAE9LNN9_9GAMM|nr:hypothetical protein [Acinetobacter tibetensis]USE81825.1 hypothetical protein M5E07_08275 [Acinetobacter tibetensis]